MTNAPKRVLIVEQYPLFRAGLLHLLEQVSNLQSLETVDSPTNLPQALRAQQPDLIIFDVPTPATGVQEYCQTMRRYCPNVRILLFGNDADFNLIRTYFRRGINGYLLKTAEGEEIIRAIRSVCNGKTYLQQSLQVNFPNWIFTPNQKHSTTRITDREKEILNLIVEEYTTREISQKLYISLCTVETHRMHLIQKLGVKNTAGLVRVALEDNLYTRPALESTSA